MNENRKVKVKEAAICFSGQVKDLEFCYPYIKKNFLDNIKSYDIFCCAEDDKNYSKIDLLKPKKAESVKSSEVDKEIKGVISRLNKGNYRDYILPQSARFNFRNIYQQLFKIKRSFILLEDYMKKEKVRYKYFIRARFDFLPIAKINPSEYKIKKLEVVVPKIRWQKEIIQINDMFSISSDWETFRTYCLMFDNYEEVIVREIGLPEMGFGKKIYFWFERNYNSSLLFLLNNPNRKGKKFLSNILGVFLLFTKIFYKKFKEDNRCNLEKAFFHNLKSKGKIVKEEPINFVILRSPMDGLLILS